MKPPPCWQVHHHVGRKMKCFPTWNEGFLPLTWHWSNCSCGPTPSHGAEEVKYFLVTQKKESQKYMMTALMTTTNMDLKHGTRRLLRVPWTERRSSQSMLKEIIPEYSLKGLMLKLKIQTFAHLMQRIDSLEKTLMLGKTEVKRRSEQ